MKIFAFVLYFVAMMAIGVFFFFKSKSANGEKEYFLGGRSMGPWVTAMSAQASDMSGWLLMGLPGSILAAGLGKIWISVGLAIGTALNWIIIAKRLRKFSKAANDSITLPQYLSNRFATANPALRIICAIVFLISFTIYVASAFKAGMDVFTNVVPGIQAETALIIFALIVLVYTFLGGFKAVCWTDFFQGILMLIALLAVPIIIAATKTLDVNLLSQVYTDASGAQYAFTTNPFKAPVSEIVSGLVWGLGYFGMPHILVRFMSIEKPSMIKKSATVSIVWVILTLGAASIIAYFGRMMLPADFVMNTPELIFIKIVNDMFPAFIAGLLLSAIIAASMSTADSQLLVASSSFTSDIYKPVIKKNASEKELLWIGRLVVVIISVIAYFMVASGKCGTIMNMVENAWGLFGAAFGPVVILSLFWKRFTYSGAVAGILAGAIVDIVWLLWIKASTGIYEILPGFVAGLIVAVIVTLISKAPSKEVCEIYDNATNNSIDD